MKEEEQDSPCPQGVSRLKTVLDNALELTFCLNLEIHLPDKCCRVINRPNSGFRY